MVLFIGLSEETEILCPWNLMTVRTCKCTYSFFYLVFADMHVHLYMFRKMRVVCLTDGFDLFQPIRRVSDHVL